MYAVTGTYYSYKYCDADELALGMTTVDTGSGKTVGGEDCVPMVYSGVKYEKCTSGDYSKLARYSGRNHYSASGLNN